MIAVAKPVANGIIDFPNTAGSNPRNDHAVSSEIGTKTTPNSTVMIEKLQNWYSNKVTAAVNAPAISVTDVSSVEAISGEDILALERGEDGSGAPQVVDEIAEICFSEGGDTNAPPAEAST